MITAEAFSFRERERHAADMCAFIGAQGSWIDDEYPWLREQFATKDAAIAAIKLAVKLNRQRYILRNDGVACGLGRVIGSQVIGNPSKRSQMLSRKLRGDRIEYLAEPGVGDAEHRDMALLLIGNAATERVLAVVNESEIEHALGIPAIMEAVGPPVDHVFIPSRQHGYGLHWKQGPLQVYMYDKAKHNQSGMSS